MIRCALAAALLLGAGPAPAAEFDIPWFQARPQERAAWLRRCRDDYRLARTPECMNAEAAAIRGRWGRPLTRPNEPWLPAPVTTPRPPQARTL